MPKSASFARHSRPGSGDCHSRTFDGLMSRWTMPAGVGDVQRLGDVDGERRRPRRGRSGRGDPLAQRDPLDELHDEVAAVVLDTCASKSVTRPWWLSEASSVVSERARSRSPWPSTGRAGPSPPRCARAWCLRRGTRAPSRPRRSAPRAGSGRREARRSRSRRPPEAQSWSSPPACASPGATPSRPSTLRRYAARTCGTNP